jgi:hypothetical protein
MARPFLILFFLLMGWSACGCAGFTSEAKCHAYSDSTANNQTIDLHPASQDAVYILRHHHGANSWPTNLSKVGLLKGDLVGFRKNGLGGITAVAGDQTIELHSELDRMSPPVNGVFRPVFDYDWCRRETAGERVSKIVLIVVMLPFMVGPIGGGM